MIGLIKRNFIHMDKIKSWLDHMWNMPIQFGVHIKNVILLILRRFKKRATKLIISFKKIVHIKNALKY